MKTLITIFIISFLLPKIDPYINKITMYKLVLYYLMALVGLACVLGGFGLVDFSPLSIGLSAFLLSFVCFFSNIVFAKIFKAPTNTESAVITALILTLILVPVTSVSDVWFLTLVGIVAMASKYIFTIQKMHIFNPVAAAVFIAPFFTNQSAIWWVGVPVLLPLVVAGGVLVMRKIRREDLVLSFFAVSALATVFFSLVLGRNLFDQMSLLLFYSPLFFFGFVMLTEPLTTPPTRSLRIVYGSLVGVFIAMPLTFGTFYFTPESSLLLGNLVMFVLSPRKRLILTMKEKVLLAPDIMDFSFIANKNFSFKPGQYIEWTLPHKKTDSRGNRRYFTIASSPTEEEIHLGVRFYPEGSSFKRTLKELDTKKSLTVASLAGDFTLPEDPSKKLLFVAGGIGITPFRSMIKYLLDTGQKRDIVLIYTAKSDTDIVYRDVFEAADRQMGIRLVYLVGELDALEKSPYFQKGELNKAALERIVDDIADRTVYISGKNELVRVVEKMVKKLGVKKTNIKKDYFPGY